MKFSLAPMDKLFSEFIRKRAILRVGGCERCKAPKVHWIRLQTAHFHGRSSKSVRWDEENAAGLCGGCHRYLDGHPLDKVEWFKEHLGEEAFEQLNIRYRQIGMPDLNLLVIYYQEKIKELSE